MKNERLLIVTVCLALGSGCLAFGLEPEKVESVKYDEAEVINSVKTVKTVKAGPPIEGQGVIIDITEDDYIVFLDFTTGNLRVSPMQGAGDKLEKGDEIKFIIIITTNGNEIIKQIQRRF